MATSPEGRPEHRTATTSTYPRDTSDIADNYEDDDDEDDDDGYYDIGDNDNEEGGDEEVGHVSNERQKGSSLAR